MRARRITALVVALGVVSGVGVALGAPASAVTYGATVNAPSRTVPWVLSLFYSGSSDAADPRFVCTATALSTREVLTAAHCVQDSGFYFVRVGADRLTDGRLIAVDAVLDHRGYGDRVNLNDVATLRTLWPMDLKAYPRPASAALVSKVNGKRPPVLTLYGWGETHDRRVPKQLLSARLDPQPVAARATYRSLFRPKLMLAAGKHNKSRNTYTGACYGDSGGPLVTTVNGVPYVVGVTSFGTAGCKKSAPTIFTSVGAYSRWLSSARRALPTEAQRNNRALPEWLTDPSVTGTVTIGNTVTCNVGGWTENGSAAFVTWHHEQGDLVNDGPTHVVSQEDAGRQLYCEVEVASDAGSSTRASAAVPVAASAPAAQ